MKKAFCILLISALLLSLWGCAATEAEEAAQVQCETFMSAITQGNWDAVQSQLPMDGLFGSAPEGDAGSNILQAMTASLGYKITSAQEQPDGSIVVKLQIENIDLKALLQSLPEGISSEEEARQAMLELMENAKRKKFSAQITLSPVEGQEEYDIVTDVSFANAVSGGMYDLLKELMEGVMNP